MQRFLNNMLNAGEAPQEICSYTAGTRVPGEALLKVIWYWEL